MHAWNIKLLCVTGILKQEADGEHPMKTNEIGARLPEMQIT